jgi:3-methyladenine DNA glycosylase AlkD
MTYEQAMKELEKHGTAQNVKVYKRHGAGDNVFGVSFANLRAMQKKIKTDHELAQKLWVSGNSDARSLAILIADPKKLTLKEADSWLKDINYYLLSDLLAGLVAKSDFATEAIAKWTKSKKEFIRQCGYNLIATLPGNGNSISDDDCLEYLQTIESEIHTAPNRARHAMNMAMCGLGIYREAIRDDVIAAARRIGKVEVDHGETSCKTPDAVAYIKKAVNRKKSKKKTKAKAKN